MLDGGLSIYTAMHLYTYVPIWLYSYTPMCLQRPPLGLLLSAWSLDSRRGGYCLTQVMFVRGGGGALALTRASALGCAGDGVSRTGKFHPHPACLHALTGHMRRPVSLAKVWVRRRRRVGFLFGFSSLCPCSLLGWCRSCFCLFGLRWWVCG